MGVRFQLFFVQGTQTPWLISWRKKGRGDLIGLDGLNLHATDACPFASAANFKKTSQHFSSYSYQSPPLEIPPSPEVSPSSSSRCQHQSPFFIDLAFLIGDWVVANSEIKFNPPACRDALLLTLMDHIVLVLAAIASASPPSTLLFLGAIMGSELSKAKADLQQNVNSSEFDYATAVIVVLDEGYPKTCHYCSSVDATVLLEIPYQHLLPLPHGHRRK
ncbi:hypothetical protein Q3G72_022461 [Acer saccharum]|nr:hypothetical protein Q3G72_022461 [Acer saccharum]